MDLSVIFVNWNSVAYLQESIASLYEHIHDISFEIIVVDNASPAGDAEIIERLPRKTTLVKSSQNLGFARANNLGFKHSCGDYLLFLNPDTRLLNSAASEMLRRMQTLPNPGIVGCKLLNSDFSVQTSCIQKFPTILNTALKAEVLRLRYPNCRLWQIGPLFSNKTEPTSVEVISGACMMVKREVFEKLGMFTEDYFMYAEDMDLCYKSIAVGHENYYVGSAVVLHYGGKSSEPSRATVLKLNALLLFLQKRRGALYTLLFKIVLSFVALGRLTIIRFLGLVGRGDPAVLRQASAKWRAVLTTLVVETSPPTNSQRMETAS